MKGKVQMIKIYDGVVEDHVAELVAAEMKMFGGNLITHQIRIINLDTGMLCADTIPQK